MKTKVQCLAEGATLGSSQRPRQLKYSLTELLESIEPDQIHEEISYGRPVGKEVWANPCAERLSRSSTFLP